MNFFNMSNSPCQPPKGGHVAYDNLERRVAVEVALGDFAEPQGLLGAVIVVIGDSVVFDVRIRLVLAAVEHEEADRPLAEGVEELVGLRVEVVLEVWGHGAARLVVATAVIHREIGREQLDSLVHEAAEHLLLVVRDGNHVAVEEEKVGRLEIALVDHVLQDVVAAVDVVDHCERDGRLGCVVGGERISLLCVAKGRGDVAVYDLMPLVADDFLRADPVSVGCGRLEALELHAVDARGVLDTDFRVENLLALGGVEVRTVVGGDFEPADGRFIGDPDDSYLVFAEVLQVRAVQDLDFGQERCDGAGKENEK